MKSSQDISNQIRAQLKILDPDFSAEPLTPERKIIDTVAEVIAGSQADQYTLQYQFDIDSKVGSDLDAFVSLFGFARKTGSAATGLVTFYVSNPTTTDIYIPAGTNVSTSTSSVITGAIVFVATSATTILAGTDSATATVQAVNVGTSGNVPAGTITTYAGTSTTQISFVNNDVATSNGIDPETDEELRLRFKNTIFRNIAGTQDQFLSIALSSPYTDKAIIIGSEDTFNEYVQFPYVTSGTSVAIPNINYAKYIYDYNYYAIQNSQGTQDFLSPVTDYTFTKNYIVYSGTNPQTVVPAFTLINDQPSRDFTTGSVFFAQFDYNSVNSRNIPASGILNYIDMYVDGSNAISVSETTKLPTFSGSSSFLLTTVTGSQFWIGNFRNKKTGAIPQAGLVYQPLIWQPITLLPDYINIGNTAFAQDEDYFLLEDVTLNRGSKLARDGVAWNYGSIYSNTNFLIASGIYQIDYQFNSLPYSLNQITDKYKQITTDVLVHAAKDRYFDVVLVIMYTPGFYVESVNTTVSSALSSYFQALDFKETIQFSDILQLVHNINGVDNVRFATPSDGFGYYGIIERAPDGVTIIGSPYISDFTLSDIDAANFNELFAFREAQNTWTGG